MVSAKVRKTIFVDTEVELTSDVASLYPMDTLYYANDTQKWFKFYDNNYVEIEADELFWTSPIPLNKLQIDGVPDGTKFLRDDGTWSEVSVGASISALTLSSKWNFNTSTSAADPSNKKFALNNSTLASVTELYINDTNTNNFDVSFMMALLEVGNRIYIQQADDPERVAIFEISSLPVDNTGWWTVPVTHVNSTGVLYQSNKECGFVFMSGGSGGSGDVVGPTSATDGAIALFDTTTGKLLKDSAKALTTVGGNLAGLTNPNAVSFLRVNADNTVTPRSATELITDIGAWSLTSGGTLTGNNEIIGTGRTLIGTWNSLGNVQTNGYGLWLRNTTAATSNLVANQQASPSIVYEMQSWEITGGTSQSVSVSNYLYAETNATSTAQGILRWARSINGGGYITLMTLSTNSAVLTVSTLSASALTSINSYASNTAAMGATTSNHMTISIPFTTSVTAGRHILINSGISLASGSLNYTGFLISPTYNFTGTHSGGTLKGIDYNPTNTSLTGITEHLAWRNTSGSVLIGHTTLGASSTRLQVRGIGTGSGSLQLWEDSSGTQRALLQDNGNFTIGASTSDYVIQAGVSGGALTFGAGTGSIAAHNASEVYAVTTGGVGLGFRSTQNTSGGAANAAAGFKFNSVGAINVTSGTHQILKVSADNGFSPTSGNATLIGVGINYALNTSGTYAGTAIGYDYNPNLTSITGLTNIAFRATSGSVLIGHTVLGLNTTRLQVRGIGLATGNIALFEDSGGTQRVRYQDNGSITWGDGTVSTSLIYTPSTGIQISGRGLSFSGATPSANTISYGGTLTIGSASGNATLFLNNGAITNTSGTIDGVTLGSISFSPSTGTVNWNIVNIKPTFTSTGTYVGTVIGYNYEPTLSSTIGLTHYAFRSTSGAMLLQHSNLGTTQSDLTGLILRNPTLALAGVQQNSPSLVFEGQGWKTNATAASQSVKFAQYVLPIQGTTNPTGQLVIGSSINGADYTNNLLIRSDSYLQLGGTGFSTGGLVVVTTPTAPSLTMYGTGIVSIGNGNSNYLRLYNDFSSGNGILIGKESIGTSFGGSTGLLNVVTFWGVYNPSSGSTDARILRINHALNTGGTWSANFYGIDYNPTLTSTTGLLHHIAWRNTSGSILIGHTTLGASTTRLQVRGIGTTTGNLALFEDSTGVERLKISDNGTLLGAAISSGRFTYNVGTAYYDLTQNRATIFVNGSSQTLDVLRDSATTNSDLLIANFERDTTGTAANNIGGYIAISVEDASSAIGTLNIGHTLLDATSATKRSRIYLDAHNNSGSVSRFLEINANSSSVIEVALQGPVKLKSYTVATVPTASNHTGSMIYVSDETGGAIPAFSDGTNWRRVTDRNIIA